MRMNSDVNPVFEEWKSSTGREKEWKYQELVERLRKFATAICWSKLPDHRNEFDPIIGNSIWYAFKYIKGFKAGSKFSTWFYRIVVNECNKFLRDLQKKAEVELVQDLPCEICSIDARIDLINMLDGLDEEDHALFRLVAEGEDFKTIGVRLGITRNAAAVRWSRLKERLRDAE